MNYKELKYYIEQLEALDTENITVAKKLLLDIAKEALIYRKQNAINARRKFSQQKVKTMQFFRSIKQHLLTFNRSRKVGLL